MIRLGCVIQIVKVTHVLHCCLCSEMTIVCLCVLIGKAGKRFSDRDTVRYLLSMPKAAQRNVT